jgi:hypothetical protein
MGRAQPGVSDASAQAALDGELAAIVRATMPVRPNDDLPRMVQVRDGSRGLFEQRSNFRQTDGRVDDAGEHSCCCWPAPMWPT